MVLSPFDPDAFAGVAILIPPTPQESVVNARPPLTAETLASYGVRMPLHTTGPGNRNICDADGDVLFTAVPRDGASQYAAAFVRMVNIQHAALGTVPVTVPVPHQDGFGSLAG